MAATREQRAKEAQVAQRVPEAYFPGAGAPGQRTGLLGLRSGAIFLGQNPSDGRARHLHRLRDLPDRLPAAVVREDRGDLTRREARGVLALARNRGILTLPTRAVASGSVRGG